MRNYETLIFSQINQIATITLNRPEVRNALSFQLVFELGDAISSVAEDSNIRVLILSGAGDSFCAGADLTEFPSSGEEIEKQLNELVKPMILNITKMEKTVICSLRGGAAGGGSALAMACDLIIMSEDAFFLEAFSSISLVPDMGASWHLVRTLGYKRAYQLMIEAERITAKRCVELGLANKVVPSDRLEEETKTWAEKLVKRAPLALGLTKKSLYHAMESNLGEVISNEAALQVRCVDSKDFSEGVKAFFKKRPPLFEGK